MGAIKCGEYSGSVPYFFYYFRREPKLRSGLGVRCSGLLCCAEFNLFYGIQIDRLRPLRPNNAFHSDGSRCAGDRQLAHSRPGEVSVFCAIRPGGVRVLARCVPAVLGRVQLAAS